MSFMDRMMEMSPGVALPNPTDFIARDWVANGFSWWAGGFALLALPAVIRKLVRDKDATMLLMWLGGLICCLLEPMLDHLGHLWWAVNLPGPVFSGFGLNIPYLIPPCYVFFISMTGYWAYNKFKDGLDIKGVFRIYFLIAMTDVIMEIPGTASGAYQYYGDVPFKVLGFPLFWGWINGLSMFMVGFLLWLVMPHLHGRNRALILFVPIVGMGGAYGMAAWPYFIALNWPMPVWATYAFTLLSLALTLVIVRVVSLVIAQPTTALRTLPTRSLQPSGSAG